MGKQTKETIIGVVLMVAAFFAWSAVSAGDASDAENAHRVHCEMVALWKQDAALNIAPEQRRGWPNYDMRECEP